MKKITLLICVFTLVSCTITRTRSTNIKFNVQTDTTLLQLLDQNNVSYAKEDIATLKDITALYKFSDEDKISIPEAYFFNKDGYRVRDNFKGTSCGQVITNIDKIKDAPTDKKELITDWIKDINFMSDPEIVNEGYDAYVIISWGVFLDKDLHAANETAFKWYESLKKDNKSLKIKAILLNLDVQDRWNLTEAQKVSLGIKNEAK
jgi:hypothetical protein